MMEKNRKKIEKMMEKMMEKIMEKLWENGWVKGGRNTTNPGGHTKTQGNLKPNMRMTLCGTVMQPSTNQCTTKLNMFIPVGTSRVPISRKCI